MNATQNTFLATEKLAEGWVVTESGTVVEGLCADGPSVFATQEEAVAAMWALQDEMEAAIEAAYDAPKHDIRVLRGAADGSGYGGDDQQGPYHS